MPDINLGMRKFVGLTRYAVFVPALAAMLGAILLLAQGSIAVVMAVFDAIVLQTPLKDTVVEVLTAVDAILLGTVLLVIGYGLYELFVDSDIELPKWLQVRDLDDLKSKLIAVVVAIIAVIFVGVVINADRAADVISYGVGAGALLLGLAAFAFATKKDAAAKPPVARRSPPKA
ncbi:MAG: YqhA family protein [Pontimonas sp.]|nr:YqhA family protein [Pontimonas sp.]